MFKEVRLKRPIYATQLTTDNFESVREYFDGEIDNGILRFVISDHPWFAIVDDWIVVYDTGDVQICSNSFYNRLYEDVPVA